MRIILKSAYPCVVIANRESFEIDENDTLEIEDENLLLIYPENPCIIPFCINLISKKDNERYSFVKRNNETILVLEKPSFVKIEQKELLNISGKQCKICVKKQEISFEIENKKISFVCSHLCNNYKIFKIKNNACIQFENDLYLYSTNKNTLSHIFGESIEVKENKIFVNKIYNDSQKREKTTVYKIEENAIIEKENFVRDNTKIKNNELLPYKILEGIKAKDYASSFEFLSDNLQNKINLESFKDFFGNMSTFLPLSTTEFLTFCDNKKNFVTFSISGNKVDDINIDSL